MLVFIFPFQMPRSRTLRSGTPLRVGRTVRLDVNLLRVRLYCSKTWRQNASGILKIFWPVILGESFDRINRIDRMGEGVGE